MMKRRQDAHTENDLSAIASLSRSSSPPKDLSSIHNQDNTTINSYIFLIDVTSTLLRVLRFKLLSPSPPYSPNQVGVWQQELAAKDASSGDKQEATASATGPTNQVLSPSPATAAPSPQATSREKKCESGGVTIEEEEGTCGHDGDTPTGLANNASVDHRCGTAAAIDNTRRNQIDSKSKGHESQITDRERQKEKERQLQPSFARIVVTCEMLRGVLGPELYESEVAARVAVPGTCTGLAWTPTGGELLFIECTSMPGSGRVKLTGKLGEVGVV